MSIKVLAVGNNNTTQADHRSLVTALTQPASGRFQRGGVLPGAGAGSISNISSMVAGVGVFRAIVPNTVFTGDYLVQSDTTINLTFDPGEAGVTRTDRIIVRVYNDTQDSSGLEQVTVEVLKGQSSGSASPLPDNSLLLYEIPVPAGASAGSGGINFTDIAIDERVYTTGSGGIIPVANVSEMNAIISPYEGMAAFATNLNNLYIYDGSLWRPKGQMNVGTESTLDSSIANPEVGTIAVTRDTGAIYVRGSSSWVAMKPTRQVYTSSGSVTWTKPAGLKVALVQVQGAGGAGGGAPATSSGESSAGGGGQGGGYAESLLEASAIPSTVTVTVGTGGSPVTGLAGNSGGDSSFGTIVKAAGGAGGAITAASSAAGAVNGGNGSQTLVGGFTAVGGGGGAGARLGGAAAFGGQGGGSVLGSGGGGTGNAGNGVAGGGQGGGGGGAANNPSNAARPGGTGRNGCVIITCFF